MPNIMVIGPASGYTNVQVDLAGILGHKIAVEGCTLVNGATGGLPLAAAEAASSAGARIVAVSPAVGPDQHRSGSVWAVFPFFGKNRYNLLVWRKSLVTKK